MVTDPVGSSLVATLSRPGGNVTGLANQISDTAGKKLEFPREIVPGLRRLAIMANVGNPGFVMDMRDAQAAARTLGLMVTTSEIRQAEDIAPASETLKGRADAIYVCPDPLMNTNRTRILANGNLTIGGVGSISGKTIALAASGAFTNNRGSDAVSASDRWLVYSSAPNAAGQNFGNLNSNNTAIWNSTYATLPPPLVTYPGNRYIFAFAAGTTPATLTVASLSDSKTYGDTANLSLFTVSGFQAGAANAYLADPHVFTGTPGLSSTGAAAIANAGVYPIIASQGTLAASGNYSFAFNNAGLLTVNPKALTITANDATQTYDGVAFSGGNGVTYSGFVNGQNASVLSGTIAYVGNSQGAANAGTYTIIPSNQTSSNYAINYVNATLTINPQPLTITANNVTQTFNNVPYSGANGVTYSGFVNGQNSSVLSGSIIYGGNSQGAVNVGTYTIIPSGQTSSNYAITYVNGTLTITPPPMAFVLDALGTAANAAGTTSPSTVMNALFFLLQRRFPATLPLGATRFSPTVTVMTQGWLVVVQVSRPRTRIRVAGVQVSRRVMPIRTSGRRTVRIQASRR